MDFTLQCRKEKHIKIKTIRWIGRTLWKIIAFKTTASSAGEFLSCGSYTTVTFREASTPDWLLLPLHGGSLSFSKSCSFWLDWHQQSHFSTSLNLTASLVFLCASHPPGRQHMLPFSTLYVFRLQMLCQQCKDLTHTAGEFATCPVPPCLWSWPVPSSFIPPWEVSKSLANTGALTVPWGARATLVDASGERRPALTDWEWSHGDLISVPSSDHLKEIKKGAEQPVYAHLQSASLLKQ